MKQEDAKKDHATDKEVATLAGGCFWCLEAIFKEVSGIEKVVSGYSGGTTVNPHYRSAIFCHNEQQKSEAAEAINQFNASKTWGAPVVTQLAPFKDFYPAEEYHREYFARNPDNPYCSVVIAPKLDKFRKQYLKKD